MRFSHVAIVRRPGPDLADGMTTFIERRPVDVPAAVAEHAGYVALLKRLGCEVIVLPPVPGLPDSVFVEDAAVVVDDLAVLTRPGDERRRPEPALIESTLREVVPRVWALPPPARLDGGDVVVTQDAVYVGRTARTDGAGVAALRDALGPASRRAVVPVAVSGCLHLKTGLSALPDGRFLGVRRWVDMGVGIAALGDRALLEPPELTGGDVLVVGDQIVLSASAPGTAELLRAEGYQVHTVSIGQFERLEAGVTCLSIVLPGRLARRPGPPAISQPG
jgi:dimethylargininase